MDLQQMLVAIRARLQRGQNGHDDSVKVLNRLQEERTEAEAAAAWEKVRLCGSLRMMQGDPAEVLTVALRDKQVPPFANNAVREIVLQLRPCFFDPLTSEDQTERLKVHEFMSELNLPYAHMQQLERAGRLWVADRGLLPLERALADIADLPFCRPFEETICAMCTHWLESGPQTRGKRRRRCLDPRQTPFLAAALRRKDELALLQEAETPPADISSDSDSSSMDEETRTMLLHHLQQADISSDSSPDSP